MRCLSDCREDDVYNPLPQSYRSGSVPDFSWHCQGRVPISHAGGFQDTRDWVYQKPRGCFYLVFGEGEVLAWFTGKCRKWPCLKASHRHTVSLPRLLCLHYAEWGKQDSPGWCAWRGLLCQRKMPAADWRIAQNRDPSSCSLTYDLKLQIPNTPQATPVCTALPLLETRVCGHDNLSMLVL